MLTGGGNRKQVPRWHVGLPIEYCTVVRALSDQLVDTKKRWYDSALMHDTEDNRQDRVENEGRNLIACIRTVRPT